MSTHSMRGPPTESKAEIPEDVTLLMRAMQARGLKVDVNLQTGILTTHLEHAPEQGDTQVTFRIFDLLPSYR